MADTSTPRRLATTHPFDDDKLKEECGIFGVWNADEAAALTVLGLHALQHRGQESAGIVSFDGQQFHAHRSMGLVGDNFNTQSVIAGLPGAKAIGHNRYSTTGDTELRNIQPLFAELEYGGFAVAHNGNLTNASTLRRQLVRRGCIFQSTMDTEVLSHLIATSSYNQLLDCFIDGVRQIEGAFSLVALTKDGLIGLRDPLGVRPLVLGKLGNAHILASETCALDIIGADFVRDIEAGEIVVCNDQGVTSYAVDGNFRKYRRQRFCIFEYVYFSRPDSLVEGRSVYRTRKAIGAELARESAVEADLVIPVPDSGVAAAIGYAAETKIPFELGIIRNHYVGRTFIEPAQHIRHLGVKLKHNANQSEIAGKRVVLVDDSIVRGTTSQKIVQMVRDAGATAVHMRIASPPTSHSCFYGIDTPSRSELMAAGMNLKEMQAKIAVDSLAFISVDGMYRAVAGEARDNGNPQYCDACFTGDYPIALVDQTLGSNERQLPLLAVTA